MYVQTPDQLFSLAMDKLKNWSSKIVDQMFRHQHAAPSHTQPDPIFDGGGGREL